MSNQEEPLPVDSYITVLKSTTIYKTAKWWQAVILGEANGRKHIGIYLWQKQGEKWKRKHKFKINRQSDYPAINKAIVSYLGELQQ